MILSVRFVSLSNKTCSHSFDCLDIFDKLDRAEDKNLFYHLKSPLKVTGHS